ncbi:MAG: hypothetical protein L0958_05130, partial [Candidatus Mariimomonas ferrooxydans]
MVSSIFESYENLKFETFGLITAFLSESIPFFWTAIVETVSNYPGTTVEVTTGSTNIRKKRFLI